jgi:hypothetical protein
VTSKDLFAPDIDIDDARQRWLFRMVHTRRPLQEKMALFWHNHFATAYSKLTNDSGPAGSEDARVQAWSAARAAGTTRTLRQYALGNFRDLVLQVAMDPAMLVWLDGQFNTRAKPQENFGREVMELFTIGVDFYTEATSTPRPVCSRVEPARVAGIQPDRHELVSGVRLQRGRTRNERQDVLVPHLQQWKPHDPGAQRVRWHAGRHRPDHCARGAPGDGPPAGSKVLELLRQRDSAAGSGFIESTALSTFRAAPRSGRWCVTS